MYKYRGSTVRIIYKGIDRKIRVNENITEEEKTILNEAELSHLLEEVKVLTDKDSLADLNDEPRPDNPSEEATKKQRKKKEPKDKGNEGEV